MRKVWQIFRAVMSVLLLMAVILPAAVYVLLSIQPVQNYLRDAAVKQLSALLGADVGIERVEIHPFRRLSVKGINVSLAGDTLAGVSTVSAGFDLYPLLARREFVLNYALVDGLWLNVSRPSPGEPMNVEPILRKLKKGDDGNKKKFSLEISTVIVRRSSAHYDVLSEPMDSTHFDANHISISDLAVNAYIPKISDESYRVNLDHLSFVEGSGFVLEKLMTWVDVEPDTMTVSRLEIRLPNSRIAFAPFEFPLEAERDIKSSLQKYMLRISTDGDNTVFLPDLRAFVPALGDIERNVGLTLDASLSLKDADVRSFKLRDLDGNAFGISACGWAKNLDNKDDFKYEFGDCHVMIDGAEVCRHAAGIVNGKVSKSLSRLPVLIANVTASGTAGKGILKLRSTGTAGDVKANAEYRRRGNFTNISANLFLDALDLGLLTANPLLGTLNARVQGTATIGHRLQSCNVNCDIASVLLNGYRYENAAADLELHEDGRADFEFNLADASALVRTIGCYDMSSQSLKARMYLAGVDFHALGFDKDREGYLFGADIDLSLDDVRLNALSGTVDISNLYWLSPDNKGMRISDMSFQARKGDSSSELSVDTPFLTGSLRGNYDFRTIAGELRDMAEHFMPAIAKDEQKSPMKAEREDMFANRFTFDFRIKPSGVLSEFFNLPVTVLYDGSLQGVVDRNGGFANMEIALPYISKGDKIIENTELFAQLDIPSDKSQIYATTQFPTKKGDMNLAVGISAANNVVHTNIDWGMERRIPLNGTLELKATLNSIDTGEGALFPVDARLDFLPGTINFGDETWSIERSSIEMSAETVSVSDFALDTGKQRIDIEGTVGRDPEDNISVVLSDIRLLPIFETLEINNVLIDGIASGNLSANNLLGAAPSLRCPALHVDSIGYNKCYFGDADVRALWDTEKNSVFLDADINGFEGKKSHIYGDIFPMKESLDLNFEADSIPVGFLKPFMAAFTSDISGRASGRCRLFGTFKDLDIKGDVYADNVKLKVDFTNVVYSATDSVHMRPGLITLDKVSVRDPEGNTALLNGEVRHTYFSRPVFNFDVTRAVDLLCFNVNEKQNPDWYGRIYGSGSARISGYPGVVNINADMTTGARSTFTFVLSDRLDAQDYSFLNFRDVTPDSLRVAEPDNDEVPLFIREMKKNMGDKSGDAPSEYNMDIRVTATPEATMTLVMDPAGGDEIKATGDGSIHMAYHSANNDLNIWGKYRVASGKYRFTLQDIIIKDFTIKEGSEIQFDGDPYAVKTSLSAFYATNANLTDLDESFGEDKNEIARTNVPVHALMNVSGDIRQPVIDFDLEFPTLTQDTYRKVRSIVSTSDMMNRQIIYLLALNRFYTPDYMASTTSGSELFSVASSTISSQLGNMLGKLSDNWSIAPNLRSDRGDFSDVEVDVALSSRLLNNRLIFNGNFGYRDKSLNTNQFIGDFDIEYLLDKRGVWRLKAYNRYNDRNYYVRQAQTTQGLGIMFRRDFDSLLSFLRKKKKTVDSDSTAVDSPADKK